MKVPRRRPAPTGRRRYCSGCKRAKPISEFNRRYVSTRKGRWRGYQGFCRACAWRSARLCHYHARIREHGTDWLCRLIDQTERRLAVMKEALAYSERRDAAAGQRAAGGGG